MHTKSLPHSAAVAMLLLACSASRADILVLDDTVMDTASGLIWSQQQIPTATFIAEDGWTVATWDQFLTLVDHAGGQRGPYSAAAANLGAWLPRLPGEYLWVYNDGYSESASCTGPANGGALCFSGLSPLARDWYVPVGGSNWEMQFAPTLSAYGTAYSPYSPYRWDVPYVTALAITPVPLPPAAWLLLSGMTALSCGVRKRRSMAG